MQTKTPTTLLKRNDGTWEFGFAAEEEYARMLMNKERDEPIPGQLFRRYKMVLKDKNEGFDTLSSPSVEGTFHPLMDLVVVTLRKLKEFALEKVGAGYGGAVEATADVQWVLTVPAIWNDFGKSFMRKAAFKAGLTREEHSTDNLILVLEPESAALAVHVSSSAHNILAQGSRFMVLDCGGGTVDITVHEVVSISPLKMRALIIPTGGDWGGDYVNLEFKNFLKELLGPELFEDKEMPLEFYTIMNEFDRIKLAFEPTKPPTPLKLVDVLDDKGQLRSLAEAYNLNHPATPIILSNALKNGYLAMSTELMLSFFEPFLAKTVQKVRDILTAQQNVATIMVVGGFGSSTTLYSRVKREFESPEATVRARVIVPPSPQGAIAHGSVYFGLHKEIITSRLAPYSYGVAMQHAGKVDIFKILVRKGEEIEHDREVTLEGRPALADQLSITWRIFRSDEEHPTTVVGTHKLGSFVVPCPPHPDPEQRRQRGVFKFGGPELHLTVVNSQGQKSVGYIVMT